MDIPGLETEQNLALPLQVGLLAIPPTLRPRQVQQMQRTLGNQVVQRAVQQLTTTNMIQRQGGGGSGNTTPIPKLASPEERNALAISVLKKAYGGRIKAEIKINAVANEGALRAEYDRSMMAQNKEFVERDAQGNEVLRRPWASGDSQIHPAMRESFSGFRDSSNGQIYIDQSKPPDEQTATIAHELLHASSGGAIIGAFGKFLDEGVTEKLTIDAFASSGYSVAGGTFAGGVSLARRIATAFGDGALTDAYFGNIGVLKSAIDERLGKGTAAPFIQAVQNGDEKKVDDYLKRGAEAAIEDLFSGWVSDDDIAAIKELYNNSVDPERSKLRYYIQQNVTSLMNHGQRAELRNLIDRS